MGRHSKQKILKCAQEMFYHLGYTTTSVDDILNQCGVARSNFYYHFKSKEELGVAVLEQQAQEMEPLVALLLENEEAPDRRLLRFLEAIRAKQTNSLHQGGCPFGSFAAGLSTHGDETAQRFRLRVCSILIQLETALKVCMEEGMRQGRFRQDIPPEEMARFVLATLEGLLILTRVQQDTGPLDLGTIVLQRLLKAT